MMKGIVHTKYGSPEFLEIGDYEKPIPKENEVLVKVKSTTVNRTDCAMLWAKPWIMRLFMGLLKPREPILGTDFAGEIVGVGKEVSLYNIGDKVFGINDMGLKSHAEYLVVKEGATILQMPTNIGFDEAAASLEGVHYAYNFINKVNLKKGQKVLVNGGTGAIGSALIQLLIRHEIEITAVCNGLDFELVKSMGAKDMVDYKKENFTQLNKKFDYVFDAVGKSSFGECKPLLVKRGIYISSELGWLAQNLFLALKGFIFKKLSIFQNRKKVVFPYPSEINKSLKLIKKLLDQDKFKPLIDRVYTFERIAEAYSYVEKGDKLGNVVINY